jgi:hypothetical protein
VAVNGHESEIGSDLKPEWWGSTVVLRAEVPGRTKRVLREIIIITIMCGWFAEHCFLIYLSLISTFVSLQANMSCAALQLRSRILEG